MCYRRLSSSSQKDYESHLQATVLTQVEGKALWGYRCKNLKVRHIQQAYDNWLQVGVRTANYRRSVLSAAWRHAMRYDVMIHNPISLVQSVNEKPRKVHWSREQVSLFLDTAYSDFRWRSIGLIVHMAYDWGQRVGDVRLLTWDSLDLNKCRIDLTQSKRNAEVHLPISQGLCSMLRQQKRSLAFKST